MGLGPISGMREQVKKEGDVVVYHIMHDRSVYPDSGVVFDQDSREP